MTDARTRYVISVMSRDRVGIVRDVAGAISRLEGDIADLRQSVLRGYFTMILMAAFPATVSAGTIKESLSQVNQRSATPLEIAVKQVPETLVEPETARPEFTYVLTASGPDQIGFVAKVSRFCADNDINILDLSTTVDGDSYVMMLQVDLSRCREIDTVYQRLEQFSRETGLHVVLQHYDIFRATNEIKML